MEVTVDVNVNVIVDGDGDGDVNVAVVERSSCGHVAVAVHVNDHERSGGVI